MNIKFNEGNQAKKIAQQIYVSIPKELWEKIKDSNAFLCGGAILSLLTNEPIRDFDFFFPTEEEFKNTLAKVQPLINKDTSLETFNSINFTIKDVKIQFIKKLFCPTIQEVLSLFDFKCVMCGMTIENIKNKTGFYSEEETLFDIAKRQLTIMSNHRNPHNVCFRIAKYVKRGWNIKGQSFINLILQQLIRAQHIKTLADVRDEIMGLDTIILAEFFKKFNKFPPTQPIAELELNELLNDINDYFDKWSEKMDFTN